MQVIELPKIVKVSVDDYGIGVDQDGTYYRIVDNQLREIPVKDVILEYIERGARIPETFSGARDLVRTLLE